MNSDTVNANQSHGNTQQQDVTNEALQYPYDIRKLLKYRHIDQHFRIEWTDGTRTWEPQENVRPDLVEQYFQKVHKEKSFEKEINIPPPPNINEFWHFRL